MEATTPDVSDYKSVCQTEWGGGQVLYRRRLASEEKIKDLFGFFSWFALKERQERRGIR